MNKEWDLNIYFLEEDDNVYSDTLRINPVLWMSDGEVSTVEYTKMYIDTTFAETRYIRSNYLEEDYGMDWTDTLNNFLEIAPPRIVSLLKTLPDAHEYYQSLSLAS